MKSIRHSWRLDVTFSEDVSRIRKGNGSAIMTSIRHLCINLFEREGSKFSLTKTQNKAAWDDNYRTKVFCVRIYMRLPCQENPSSRQRNPHPA